MCGIFGTVSPDPLTDPRPVLEALTDLMRHRGPDGRGSYMDTHAFFGHRRLAIIDREGGAQPMVSPCGRYALCYNGEIYNFREVRNQLRQRGHTFRTVGDTEVVLRAHMEWGIDSVLRFNGIFAYAIWDRQERRLFLVRDRLGVKPLYYTFIGRQIIFASEMKSLTAYPGFVRRANLPALSSYLTFRTVVGTQTVFEGIGSLAPGCYIEYHDGASECRRYWDIACPEPGTDLGEDYYLGRTAELLRKAVARQMVSDVPVGAYLSGGVDSSLLVALAQDLSDRPLKTYSIGFEIEGYDEGPFSRLASEHVGTEHRHLLLGADAYNDELETLIRHRDQPLSIPHELALFLLSKEIKTEVSVCLSGEGADELFGGYGRVQASPFDFARLRLFHKLPSPLKSIARAMVGDEDLRNRLSITDELEHFFHVYNWWSFEDKQALLTDEALMATAGDGAVRQIFRDAFSRFDRASPYDRVFHVFEKLHLVNLLDRLDMQSMAASVEARVPFTDHELVEFVSAIPLRYKIRWNSPLSMLRACFLKSADFSERFDTTKYLLRRLADNKLPQAISRRKKLGFPVPLDSWFGNSMYRHAADILLDDRTRARGIFRQPAVEALLRNCRQSAYDTHGKKIWMLLNVELWFRNHIDGEGSPMPSQAEALQSAL